LRERKKEQEGRFGRESGKLCRECKCCLVRDAQWNTLSTDLMRGRKENNQIVLVYGSESKFTQRNRCGPAAKPSLSLHSKYKTVPGHRVSN